MVLDEQGTSPYKLVRGAIAVVTYYGGNRMAEIRDLRFSGLMKLNNLRTIFALTECFLLQMSGYGAKATR